MKGFTNKKHKGRICPSCYQPLYWNPLAKVWECLNDDCESYDIDEILY